MQEITRLRTPVPRAFPARSERDREPDSEHAVIGDKDLFEAFFHGDEEAFVALFGRHNQRMYNFCAKMINDVEAAGDVTQSVWERLIRMPSGTMVGRSTAEIENPLGLLYRIARNMCFDHLKHARHSVRIEEINESEHPLAPEQVPSRDEELVVAALDNLPKETKEILVLHYYSGFSFDEIADILGKKSNAVWTRVSRARATLKAEVEWMRTLEDRHESRS